MKCPIDDTELVMSERQGIEIDYCPSCRGVWLDRGELDKLIERSAPQVYVKQTNTDSSEYVPAGLSYSEDYRRGTGYDRGEEDEGKRKKSFLDEIFDF